jgi:hypothetical protein
MDNVYNEAGAEVVHVTLANNTRAELQAHFLPCKLGIETDQGKLGFTDHNGTYRSVSNDGHDHDDRYYTESEVDDLLSEVVVSVGEASVTVGNIVVRNPTGDLEYQPAITAGKIIVADANGRPVAGTNTDTEVALAVTNSHNKSRLFTSANLSAISVIDQSTLQFGDNSSNLVRLTTAGQDIALRPAGYAKAGRGLNIIAGSDGTDPGSDPLTLREDINDMPRKLKILCVTNTSEYSTLETNSSGYFVITTDTLRVSNLAGIGNRTVMVNANGDLYAV